MNELISRLSEIAEVDKALTGQKLALVYARNAYGDTKRLRRRLAKPIIKACYNLIVLAIQRYNLAHPEIRICHSPLHITVMGPPPDLILFVHLITEEGKEPKRSLSETGFDQIEKDLKMAIVQTFGENGNPFRLKELRAPRRYFKKK